MAQPEEGRAKTTETDEVLLAPDGDPHHTPAQAPQPDEHLPVEFTHDGEVEILDEDG